MSTINEKEMKILSFLSTDNTLKFLKQHKQAQLEYGESKKAYDKFVNDKLKEIADGSEIKVENDIFKVTISAPQEVEKLISVAKARKLDDDVKKLIFTKGKQSARLRVVLIEDETDE